LRIYRADALASANLSLSAAARRSSYSAGKWRARLREALLLQFARFVRKHSNWTNWRPAGVGNFSVTETIF